VATRPAPADARSRRCKPPQSPGGRPCALVRLGPLAHSACWTQSVVRHAHAAPRRGLNAAPLPPAPPTACVGVLRRKPPRNSSSVLRPVDHFEAGRLVASQGGFLRWRSGSGVPHALAGCGPGSGRAAGAAPGLGPPLDLPGSFRPSSDRAGARRTSGSATAPAVSARRPSAAAPNTHCGRRLQRRQRCIAMTCSRQRSSRSPSRQAVAWTAAARSASARSASVLRLGSGRPSSSSNRVSAEGSAPVVYQAGSGRFVMPHVATFRPKRLARAHHARLSRCSHR
jgi:hypothetical protein